MNDLTPKNPWLIRVRSGLVDDPKHRKRIGDAVWLYLHLLGQVDLETATVVRKFQTLADALDLSFRTIQRHINRLEGEGYITTTRRAHSVEIKILKPNPAPDKNGQSPKTDRTRLSSQTPEDRTNVTGHEATDRTGLSRRPDKVVQSPNRKCFPRSFPKKKDDDDVVLEKVDLQKTRSTGGPSPSSTPSAGDSKGLDRWAGEVDRFLGFCEKAHRRARGAPLVVTQAETDKAAAMIAQGGFDGRLLRAAFWLFLGDRSGWLAKKSARTVAMFLTRLNNYLAAAAALLADRKRRRVGPKELESPVAVVSPKPLNGEVGAAWLRARAHLRENTLPENFETWIEPIFPCSLESGALGLAVPNEFFRKCLSENYGRDIWEAWTHAEGPSVDGVKFIVYDPKLSETHC